MGKHKLQHIYTDELCETQQKRKHKKHKHKEQIEIETAATQDKYQTIIPSKCQKDQSEIVESNTTVHNMSQTSSCKKKKKRKKECYNSEELDENTGGNKAKLLEDEVLPIPNKKKKHKTKKRHNEDSIGEDIHVERDPESNKNKESNYMNRSEKHVNNCDNVHEAKTGENMPVKKKKKHKRKHCEHENPSSEMEMMMENSVKNTTDDYPPKKKSKKKHKKRSLDTSETGVDEDIVITNNIQQSNLVSNGNQVKKGPVGALDTNMSTEELYSQQSNNKHDAPMPTMAGQWKTASFGSEERQTKFLKLLGAFKKEGVTNNRFNVAKAEHGNVAMSMTTKEENNYRNVMTNEYEKALVLNIQRGTGLGFEKPAAEGKKFHIDINKSRSVKFDD